MSHSPTRRSRRVIFQPRTAAKIGEGVNQIVNAIAPTLGPLPRIVASQGVTNGVELLDDGGTIARRIVGLPDPDADVGAMYLRQLLWHLHEDVGDGTATAAVIFQAIYHQGLRFIAAGGDAQRIRSYLNQGLQVIIQEFGKMSVAMSDEAQVLRVAHSICADPSLAEALGEAVYAMGEYGCINIRASNSREAYCEAVAGTYWDNAGLFSSEMILDRPGQRTELENVAILLSDLEIEEPKELSPALLCAVKAGYTSVAFLAQSLSDAAIGFLVANCQSEKIRAIAVKTPGKILGRDEGLHDLALLTGGTLFLRATNQTLLNIRPEDFGHAARFWARMDAFGIVDGAGDGSGVDEFIVRLHDACRRTDDREARQKLSDRIGKLMGGSITLRVGGATNSEVDFRKEAAQRAIRVLRAALAGGMLPGGGTALLACRGALRQKMEHATSLEERAAYSILLEAAVAPFCRIVANAGYDPSQVLAGLSRGDALCGFDVLSGHYVDVVETGIWDVAAAQKQAVRSAVESAALALTVDVLVHRRRLPTELTT